MEWVFVAGVALSVISEFMGAAAKKRALQQQAGIEESQAALALQDASYDAWRTRMKGHADVGAVKTAYAASGVATDSGTPLGTMEQLTFSNVMDAHIAELRGARIAWTHRERARLLRQGVDDVEAALPINLASDVISAYGAYSAIGSPATKKNQFSVDPLD